MDFDSDESEQIDIRFRLLSSLWKAIRNISLAKLTTLLFCRILKAVDAVLENQHHEFKREAKVSKGSRSGTLAGRRIISSSV